MCQLYGNSMSKIFTDIGQYVFDKIEVVIVFLIVAGGMYVVNIILGSLNAIFTNEFDWKKHLYGVAKAVVACCSILMFCLLLNLFSYGLSLINVVLPDSVVTIIEVICILVGWCYDLSLDIIDKIKGLKTLKYISYDDIQQNSNPQEEVG